MFNGYNQPLYESDSGRDNALKKSSHQSPWSYGQTFYNSPEVQQAAPSAVWPPKQAYPGMAGKCACVQCQQGPWYHKESDPALPRAGSQEMMLLGSGGGGGVGGEYPMDVYPRSDGYLRASPQVSKSFQSCPSYPVPTNQNYAPRLPVIKQNTNPEFANFDRSSEQYMRMLDSSAYARKPPEQRSKYWEGFNGAFYPSQQYQYPASCRYPPYNSPYYYQGSSSSQPYQPPQYPQQQNGMQQYYGIVSQSMRPIDVRPQFQSSLVKQDNALNKISPLRLMRKKKMVESVGQLSPPRALPTVEDNGPTLDVRRFLATWADEDEDVAPVPQMVVLDCQDINPEQAELLRLYEESAIRIVQEPIGDQPDDVRFHSVSEKCSEELQHDVAASAHSVITDPAADKVPDMETSVITSVKDNILCQQKRDGCGLEKDMVDECSSSTTPPSPANSHDSLPTLADLPTSEYRKNKFLDYDQQSFPELPVQSNVPDSSVAASCPTAESIPEPTELRSSVQERKYSKKRRKPTIRFSIQKSHDLKISLRVMNEGNRPLNEEVVPEEAERSQGEDSQDMITLRLRGSPEGKSDGRNQQTKRNRKLKRRKLLKQTYSVSSEDHSNDVIADGFQVQESVDSAKIKLTFKRRRGEGDGKRQPEDFTKRKKKGNQSNIILGNESVAAESSDHGPNSSDEHPMADTTTDYNGLPPSVPAVLAETCALSPLMEHKSVADPLHTDTPDDDTFSSTRHSWKSNKIDKALISVSTSQQRNEIDRGHPDELETPRTSNPSSPKLSSSCLISSPRTSTDSIERELQAIWNGDIKESVKIPEDKVEVVSGNDGVVDFYTIDISSAEETNYSTPKLNSIQVIPTSIQTSQTQELGTADLSKECCFNENRSIQSNEMKKEISLISESILPPRMGVICHGLQFSDEGNWNSKKQNSVRCSETLQSSIDIKDEVKSIIATCGEKSNDPKSCLGGLPTPDTSQADKCTSNKVSQILNDSKFNGSEEREGEEEKEQCPEKTMKCSPFNSAQDTGTADPYHTTNNIDLADCRNSPEIENVENFGQDKEDAQELYSATEQSASDLVADSTFKSSVANKPIFEKITSQLESNQKDVNLEGRESVCVIAVPPTPPHHDSPGSLLHYSSPSRKNHHSDEIEFLNDSRDLNKAHKSSVGDDDNKIVTNLPMVSAIDQPEHLMDSLNPVCFTTTEEENAVSSSESSVKTNCYSVNSSTSPRISPPDDFAAKLDSSCSPPLSTILNVPKASDEIDSDTKCNVPCSPKDYHVAGIADYCPQMLPQESTLVIPEGKCTPQLSSENCSIEANCDFISSLELPKNHQKNVTEEKLCVLWLAENNEPTTTEKQTPDLPVPAIPLFIQQNGANGNCSPLTREEYYQIDHEDKVVPLKSEESSQNYHSVPSTNTYSSEPLVSKLTETSQLRIEEESSSCDVSKHSRVPYMQSENAFFPDQIINNGPDFSEKKITLSIGDSCFTSEETRIFPSLFDNQRSNLALGHDMRDFSGNNQPSDWEGHISPEKETDTVTRKLDFQEESLKLNNKDDWDATQGDSEVLDIPETEKAQLSSKETTFLVKGQNTREDTDVNQFTLPDSDEHDNEPYDFCARKKDVILSENRSNSLENCVESKSTEKSLMLIPGTDVESTETLRRGPHTPLGEPEDEPSPTCRSSFSSSSCSPRTPEYNYFFTKGINTPYTPDEPNVIVGSPLSVPHDHSSEECLMPENDSSLTKKPKELSDNEQSIPDDEEEDRAFRRSSVKEIFPQAHSENHYESDDFNDIESENKDLCREDSSNRLSSYEHNFTKSFPSLQCISPIQSPLTKRRDSHELPPLEESCTQNLHGERIQVLIENTPPGIATPEPPSNLDEDSLPSVVVEADENANIIVSDPGLLVQDMDLDDSDDEVVMVENDVIVNATSENAGELEDGEVVDEEYIVVEQDEIILEEGVLVEVNDDAEPSELLQTTIVNVADIPLPPGEAPQSNCFDLEKWLISKTESRCVVQENPVIESCDSPFPSEVLDLFRNPSPPGTPRLVMSPTHQIDTTAGHETDDTIVECHDVTTHELENLCSVVPSEMDGDAVPDDAKFHDVMENCLANAKKFLNRESANDEDYTNHITSKDGDFEQVAEEHISSRDVLFSAFEAASDLEMGVSSADVSMDFSPFNTTIGPESLPVDNWPYLEEEVPLSPTWSVKEEDVPLNDNGLTSSVDLMTHPLLPRYLCTDRSRAELRVIYGDTQKCGDAQLSRFRNTLDANLDSAALKTETLTEPVPGGNDADLKNAKVNEARHLICKVSLERLSDEKCLVPQNDKGSVLQLDELESTETIKSVPCINEDYRCSKWQPMVVLPRLSKDKIFSNVDNVLEYEKRFGVAKNQSDSLSTEPKVEKKVTKSLLEGNSSKLVISKEAVPASKCVPESHDNKISNTTKIVVHQSKEHSAADDRNTNFLTMEEKGPRRSDSKSESQSPIDASKHCESISDSEAFLVEKERTLKFALSKRHDNSHDKKSDRKKRSTRMVPETVIAKRRKSDDTCERKISLLNHHGSIENTILRCSKEKLNEVYCGNESCSSPQRKSKNADNFIGSDSHTMKSFIKSTKRELDAVNDKTHHEGSKIVCKSSSNTPIHDSSSNKSPIKINHSGAICHAQTTSMKKRSSRSSSNSEDTFAPSKNGTTSNVSNHSSEPDLRQLKKSYQTHEKNQDFTISQPNKGLRKSPHSGETPSFRRSKVGSGRYSENQKSPIRKPSGAPLKTPEQAATSISKFTVEPRPDIRHSISDSLSYKKGPCGTRNKKTLATNRKSSTSGEIIGSPADSVLSKPERMSMEDETSDIEQPWICAVCGFSDATQQQKHIQEHSFHCQSCHLAFISEDHFVQHLTQRHQDIRKLHHCLLCELSFDSDVAYQEHLTTREHIHIESVEKNTINTLFTLLCGEACSVLGPVEPRPEWLPNQAGTVHFYHQATPLALALQFWKMKQSTATLPKE